MTIKDKEIQSVRIPIIGSLQQRTDSLSKDQLFSNGFFEVFQNPNTGHKTYQWVKRPGGALQYNVTGGAATARGMMYWPTTSGGTGQIYAVYGTKIWASGAGTFVDLGVTLTTSAGFCGLAYISPSAGTPYICINDGVKLYIINTSNVVTTITTNFPTPNNADLVYMDGCLFTSKTNGTIYHCNIEDPTTWDPTKFITAEMYEDGLTAVAHQNNLLAAFGPFSTEFFYDAGNASGSILSKLEQSVQMVGCLSRNSIVSQENNITFVGSSKTAGYGVFTITGTSEIKKISTPVIDRWIANEHTNVVNIYAVSMRSAGHYFYILTLPTAAKSFVYDHTTNMWYTWSWKTDGQFQFYYITEVAAPWYGYFHAQHASDGKIYLLGPEYFQDDSTNVESFFITDRVDMESGKRKFLHAVELIGDKATSTQNVSVNYSDDDYQNFSTARTIDQSGRAFSRNWGTFHRRAFKVSYTGNQPWRISALELTYSEAEE